MNNFLIKELKSFTTFRSLLKVDGLGVPIQKYYKNQLVYKTLFL